MSCPNCRVLHSDCTNADTHGYYVSVQITTLGYIRVETAVNAETAVQLAKDAWKANSNKDQLLFPDEEVIFDDGSDNGQSVLREPVVLVQR